jgi:hypothetical protein
MYTAKEYIDDIKLRCSRLSVTLELDDPTILTFINASRKRVQQSTIALYPERYSKIVKLDITNAVPSANSYAYNPTYGYTINIYSLDLPDDFIDAHVIKLRYKLNGTFQSTAFTNVTFNNEARRYDKRELYKLLTQTNNRPTILSPAYAIERNIVTVSAGVESNSGNGYVLLLAGLDTSNGYLPDEVAYVSGEVEVWYTALVSDLEEFPSATPGVVADREVTIPAEFEELVMMHTMVACMQKVRAAEAITMEVMSELTDYEKEIFEVFAVTKQKAGSLLPSRESIPQ